MNARRDFTTTSSSLALQKEKARSGQAPDLARSGSRADGAVVVCDAVAKPPRCAIPSGGYGSQRRRARARLDAPGVSNAAVLESCARIEAALSGSPAFRRVDEQLYVVKQGSAYVLVQVIPWGAQRALVRMVAQLVRNASMTETLALRLLKLNARLRFGAFGWIEEGQLVTFTHTLLGGRTLDRDELLSALRDVALLADEWDNTIAEQSGGETFEMILQDELVAQLQRELIEGSWQKN